MTFYINLHIWAGDDHDYGEYTDYIFTLLWVKHRLQKHIKTIDRVLN